MPTAITTVDQLERIRRGPEAWRLATAVYGDLFAVLEELDPDDWQQPTACDPWTVADTVRHLVGAAESHASLRVGLHQQVWAMRHKDEFGGSALDAWTARHLRQYADLQSDALLARLREVAPRAVRGRARFPSLLGGIPVPLDQAGNLPAGSPTRVTLGDLNTVIFTRDTWMHRLEIERATGRSHRLTAEVDGRIVQDLVVDWAHRHGSPFRLTLTGPAGGTFVSGRGPDIELGAVAFAWIVSGRTQPDADDAGAGLLRTRVLF